MTSHTESLKYFSIFKIILLHQNYTTIWMYSDQFNSDVIFDYFVKEYAIQPKSLFDLNNLQNQNSLNLNLEEEYFQDTLHIFFISQPLDQYVLDHVPAKHNVVVIFENGNVDRLLLTKAGDFGRKILFITSLYLCLLKSSKNRYMPINSNESILSNFVRNAFSPQSSYSHYNLNGSILTTFFQQKGALSFIQLFDNKLMFFGPDGFVTEQLGKLFNGTVIANTDFGIAYPQYKAIFTETVMSYSYFINFYKETVTTNVISNFHQRKSDYADLYMSSQPLKLENHGSKNSTEFLYPHMSDCLRIMVPRINVERTFHTKLIRNQYCQTICLACILMALFRIIFGRTVIQKWPNDIFITISIFFAQCDTTRSNQSWESIWNGSMVLFSSVSTAVLSALCYITIVSVQFQEQINSLEDLIESNLTIFVPEVLAADVETWGSNLNPKLAEKIVIKDKMWMLTNETHFATVWPEEQADLLLKFAPVDGSVRVMRIMKEPLYCGLISYSVPFKSPLKQMVNIIVRRMIESGLRDKQLEWSRRYLNARALKKKSEIQQMSTSTGLTLNMSQLFGVFILYGVGICMSFTVALIELLLKSI